MSGGEAPGAGASHRQAGEIQALVIDLVFLHHGIEHRHGAIGVGAAGFPETFLAALREDHEEREFLLAVLEFYGVADALLDRRLAVVAAFAGAVQEEDQRYSFSPV